MKTNYQRILMVAAMLLLATSTPLLASETDGQIESSFKESYVSQNYLKGDAVKAESKDGVVTLHGHANSSAQMDLATEYAKDVKGVKEVKNEMTVSAAAIKPKEQTMGQRIGVIGEKVDDASITGLVKMTLLYHRSTSAINTLVETNDGLVNLGGMARNAAEKDLVTQVVSDVYGVKVVVNNMTVKEI